MEGKLKIAKQEETEPKISQQPIPEGYFVPAKIMDDIIGYIGQGSWFEVNDFINSIRTSVQPVYSKKPKNETEN